MSTSRPFAYNTGSTISGTEQIGSLAIGVDALDYSEQPGGVQWWNGPDEDLGYVIALPNTSGTQPNDLGIPAYVGFEMSELKTEESFVSLVNQLFNQSFTTGNECKTYLNNNGFWTSWVNLTPTITPTPTPTPIPTIVSFTTVETTTWTAPAGVTSVEYLVVGGGGGGGNGYDTGGGGGGAGGMVLTGTLSVTPGNSYTVIVGSGGTGGDGTRANNNGTPGDDSVFDSITALGGDFGNGSRTVQIAVGRGGSAQVSNTTTPTGGDGGGNAGSAVGGSGGGGGGATGNGGNGSASSGGSGGAGLSSSISGSAITYGIGGNGARGNVATTGANGTTNRGNGGGAGGCSSGCGRAGGNGGSGIVILKY